MALPMKMLHYPVRPLPNLKQIVFNVMLREWGVRGIQVNEVVPLDAIFGSSPTSTYGLIFLSRYSSTRKKQENIQIPQNLWFANQVRAVSCSDAAIG
jgi:ubiquitin carboxyl-terminal hydrolase L5